MKILVTVAEVKHVDDQEVSLVRVRDRVSILMVLTSNDKVRGPASVPSDNLNSGCRVGASAYN